MNAPAGWTAPSRAAEPVASRWLRPLVTRAIVELLCLLAASLVVALLLAPGLQIAASAAPALQGLVGTGSAAADGAWPVLLRRILALLPAGVRAEPLWALQWLQTAIGGAGLYLVGRLAWSLGKAWTAVPALLLALLWPASRQALLNWSAESVLAVAALAAAWAAVGQARAPRRAALGLGTAVALTAAVHPLGLLAGLLLLLGAMLLPLEPPPRMAGGGLAETVDRPDFPTGARWLPWLAAALWAVGLLLALLSPAGIKAWGSGQFALLRRPEDALVLGGAANLPLLGAWVALVAQTPLALLWLALGPLQHGLGRYGRASPLAGLAVVAFAWLLVLAIAGAPLTGALDGLIVLAPLLCVLAGVGFSWRFKGLLHLGHRGGVAVWLVSAALLLGADLWLASADRRTLIGRIPGLLNSAEVLRGAVLGPADLALLQRFGEPTAILPGQRGGNDLGNALKPLVKSVEQGQFVAGHVARLALLPEPPSHPVDRALADHGTRLGCTADLRHCLVRIAGRPDSPPAGKPAMR